MALWILRFVFFIVSLGFGLSLATSDAYRNIADENTLGPTWLVFTFPLFVACGVIATDLMMRTKRIEVVSCVYFGIVVGLLLAYVVSLALTPLTHTGEGPTRYSAPIAIGLGIALSYTCISLLLQTRDDFRFVIPYVEFAKEVKGMKPYVLDTSVVIDGRIADLIETGVLDNQLIIPRFALQELQNIADSSDKLRRSRGRRGLDVLNRMRSDKSADLQIFDRELKEMTGHPVDMKLVLLAKHLEGKVVTNDYNLNKVAKLHQVPVINLNEIANSLKPAYIPGEQFNVKVLKQGEEAGQGVGYLDDGTMIVIESGRDHIGKLVKITVTSVLQTSAGRMIFGRYEQELQNDH